MKTLLTLALLLLLPLRAFAFCDDWHTSDTVLLAGALIVSEVDREQTQWFAARYDQGYYEKDNFWARGHPTATTIDTTAALEVAAALAVTCLLNHPWRDMFLGVWIVSEVGTVGRNQSIGTPTPFLGYNVKF